MDIDNYYKLIFTNSFERELDNQFNYLMHKCHYINTAYKISNQIDDKLMQIRLFPKAFGKYENTEFRKAPVKKCVIIFKLDEKKKEIYILHIFNSRSNYIKKYFYNI